MFVCPSEFINARFIFHQEDYGGLNSKFAKLQINPQHLFMNGFLLFVPDAWVSGLTWFFLLCVFAFSVQFLAPGAWDSALTCLFVCANL